MIHAVSTTEYVAPGNETEKKLVSIFKEVLKAEHVGIMDNFFELGGHSLKAISFRTSFGMEDGEPVQYIASEIQADVSFSQDKEDNLEQIYVEFIRPFDLSAAPLFRMKVVELEEKKHVLYLDMHHIIADGTSTDIIFDEFMKLYNQEELEPLTVQYKDYSEWMKHRDLSGQESYWLRQFEEEVPVLELPLDYRRPSVQTYHGAMVTSYLEEDDKKIIQDMCQRLGITEYMAFLSGLMILFGKYGRQEDIVIGSAVSGRMHKDTEHMIGMFVNTLAMRGKPEAQKTCRQFLMEMKDTCLQAFDNQEYPFEELVEHIQVNREVSRNPLFDIMFVMQNTDNVTLELNNSGVTGEVERKQVVAKFDMTWNLVSYDGGYMVNCEYCTDLYRRSSIKAMLSTLRRIMLAMAAQMQDKIGSLHLVSEEEKDRIHHVFNNTYHPERVARTVKDIFEDQVKKYPEKTAVRFEDAFISYEELNRKANQLAHRLRENGVKENEFVALLADKSLEFMIGILAIVKAGGAYMTIDTAYPEERIVYLLEDAKPKLILCTKELALNTAIPVWNLMKEESYSEDTADLETITKMDDLIYIIYTSGTTGKPKGTLIPQKGVTRLVIQPEYLELNADTVILQTGAMVFDASTLEIWGALLNGGTLCLLPQEIIQEPQILKEKIQTYHVNTMWLTAQLYNQLVVIDITLFDSLKYLLAGGEKLSEKHIAMLRQHNPSIHIINGYGPTENTTFTTIYEIHETEDTIPIGKPVANTFVYVINEGELAPIGMPGELCIGGDGLAKGYLNNETLNKEKFFVDPERKERLYHSGDLVRWREDGNIEYLGRMDEQVKLRGFRIELDEISNALKVKEHIKDAVTVVKEMKGTRVLVSYLVSDEETDIQALKDVLHKELPQYMIPSYIQQIEKMPVTANGKIDRRALPEPEYQVAAEYIAPVGQTEEELAEIFTEVLGAERVSRQDNFFEIGGDSIKVIRIVDLAKKRGYSLSVKDVLTEKTVALIARKMSTEPEQREEEPFAAFVMQKERIVEKSPELTEHNVVYKLLKTYDENMINQERKATWEVTPRHQYFIDNPGGDICFALAISSKINAVQLQSVLKRIIMEQAVLRCSYNEKEGFIEYTYNNRWKIPYLDLEDARIGADTWEELLLETYAQPSIYMQNKLLVKFLIVHTQENTLELHVFAHHCVWDNMSSIIMKDLVSEYLQNGTERESCPADYFEVTSRCTEEEMDVLKKEPCMKKFQSEMQKFASVIKCNNSSAILFSRRLSDEEKEKMKENVFAWAVETLKAGWSLQEGHILAELEAVPIVLNHNARNDENLNVLGLFLDIYPVLYDRKNPDSIKEQTAFYREEFVHKNGLLYSCLLKEYEKLECPAVDMNLVELFDTEDESLELEQPIFAENTGLSCGMAFNLKHNQEIVQVEMSVHPEKKQEILRGFQNQVHIR